MSNVVPPIADQNRVQTYTVSAPTTTIDLTFPLFGSAEDLVVTVDGQALSSSLWSVASLSGVPINEIALPITDGVITFNPAIASGTIVITYLWQPRTGTMPNAAGISRFEFNQKYAEIVASLRELCYLYEQNVVNSVSLSEIFIQTLGAPAAGSGIDGGMAWDSTNLVLYGPREAGVWPAGVSLQGAPGSGTFTVHTSVGAPSSGVGVNGDIDFDFTNYVFYGPKAAGAWPAGVSMIANGAPLNSPAFTGAPTAPTPAQADASTDIATTAFVSQNMQGGLINKLMNGAMDVWQRGTTPTLGGAGAYYYTADGWGVNSSGAVATVAQAAGRGPTVNSLQVTGATGVTLVGVRQRIESYVAAPMAGQQVTVQAQIFNDTGASITPTITVSEATAQDNWTSSTVVLATTALQPCANGAWTNVSYTFAAPSGVANGMSIIFGFGNNFAANTQSIKITEVDLRVTPGVASGLNSAPPPAELRPIFSEMAFCCRYYQASDPANGTSFSGDVTDANTYYAVVLFPVPMRAAPTVTLTTIDHSNFPAPAGGTAVGPHGFFEARISNTTGAAGLFQSSYTASAEL